MSQNPSNDTIYDFDDDDHAYVVLRGIYEEEIEKAKRAYEDRCDSAVRQLRESLDKWSLQKIREGRDKQGRLPK